MNIFVGNLNFKIKDYEIKSLFEEFGEVNSVKIITDKFTGRSKGYGFVEMTDDSDARKAIEQLNEKEVGGRNIVVNEAKPRDKKF